MNVIINEFKHLYVFKHIYVYIYLYVSHENYMLTTCKHVKPCVCVCVFFFFNFHTKRRKCINFNIAFVFTAQKVHITVHVNLPFFWTVCLLRNSRKKFFTLLLTFVLTIFFRMKVNILQFVLNVLKTFFSIFLL